MSGEEWRTYGRTDGYVLTGIKVLAAGRTETPPITLQEFADISGGNISRREIARSNKRLAEAGKIKTRRTQHGIVYAVVETREEKSFVRKVAEVELKLGVDAPDEVVQLAMTPIRRDIKRARRTLAKARAIAAAEKAVG